MILFRSNSFKELIPFEDGVPLCNFDNPRQQAAAWAQAQRPYLENQQVIVLGLGATLHIEELLKYTSSPVIVLENRIELISLAQKKDLYQQVEIVYIENSQDFVDKLIETLSFYEINMSSILEFRPCYGTSDSFFTSLYGLLTGRTRYGVEFHMVFQNWMKKSKAHFQKRLHHWQDLDSIVDAEKLTEQHYHLFSAMKEMSK